jgi:hypothetical protein
MKIRNNITQVLLMLLVCITSCVRSVDCDNCGDNLKTVWSYKLRLPFGMDLADGEIIIQNNNLSKIVILDGKTGLVNKQLPTAYSENGEGAVVRWAVNKELIVYEQVLDYQKSYIKIYNRAQYKSKDSILISIKKDLSVSHGIVKMFGRPAIIDTTLLFILNDGTLNSYNLLKKRLSWSYRFNSLPVSNSTIITTKRYVHIQMPVYLGGGFEIVTLSKETGKLIWKKYFPGQMQLSKIDDKLLDIDKYGNLIYIDPANGQFDSHHFIDRRACYYQIINNKLIALSTEDNTLIVKDIDSSGILLKYKLCAKLVDINYSKKMDALLLVDEGQHCIQINLNNLLSKCIQQFVDNNDSRQNFIVKGDSLYINKGGELRLLKLK